MSSPIVRQAGKSAGWTAEVLLPAFSSRGMAHAAVQCTVEIVADDMVAIDFTVRREGGAVVFAESLRLTGEDLEIAATRRK